MEAVIATGGKQYRVSPGQVISVEKLPAATKGGTVEFTDVLLVNQDGKITAAPGELRRAKVSAEVLGERKGRKVTVVKFRRRKNYRRTRGHRQPATAVRITKIEV
jgi:large subunit ribosomal protein L21